jgi:hypothetical protein
MDISGIILILRKWIKSSKKAKVCSLKDGHSFQALGLTKKDL